LGDDLVGELTLLDADVLLHLRPALHHARDLRQAAAAQGAAQKQAGGEAVAGDVVAQVDDVARLLAAEQRPLALQRLEHVPVADGGRVHPDAVPLHERVEAEIRHHGHRDLVDAQVERERGHDLVAVDDLAALVDREHAVAVAVERDAEVEAAVAHRALQKGEVGRAAAHVDVRAVGRVADRVHDRAAALERRRGDTGVRAVRAVDGEAQPGEVLPEALEDVVEIGVGRDLDVLDAALVDAGRRGEQLLDLLLGLVRQLASVRVEELDAVVLRRVVRGGDDDAEVERRERDGRRRQHAADDAVAARRDDAAREALLELDPRGARVPADEHLRGARPERGRAAEPLDERRRQKLADDPTDTIGAEEPARHEVARYRLLNCGALRALCRPAFLRSTSRASRVKKPARFSGTRSSGLTSTSARATPWRTAPACPEGPPPCTRTRRSYWPSTSAVLSGAIASMRWTSLGKYSSIDFPLIHVAPLPGRRITRATDVLRLPVPRY